MTDEELVKKVKEEMEKERQEKESKNAETPSGGKDFLSSLDIPKNSKAVALLVSFFFGSFGFDRFYMGYTVLGIIKLLISGGFGIWWLIDLIMIGTGSLKNADGSELQQKPLSQQGVLLIVVVGIIKGIILTIIQMKMWHAWQDMLYTLSSMY